MIHVISVNKNANAYIAIHQRSWQDLYNNHIKTCQNGFFFLIVLFFYNSFW